MRSFPLKSSRSAGTAILAALALHSFFPPTAIAQQTELTAASGAKARHEVGQTFQDCKDCPLMVVVPPGAFRMGSKRAEQDWSVEHGRKRDYTDRENPQHEVRIAKPFAVGAHEVTRAQFFSFVADTGRQPGDRCDTFEETDGKYTREQRLGRDWRNAGHPQTDDHPVGCVSWDDASAYAAWLSNKTGARYRLLSEAEWEYVARSGTETYRYWGDDASNVEGCRYANAADKTPFPNGETWPTMFACTDGFWATSPVGSFQPTAFGIYDVMGNVWEWVDDCWNATYDGAPVDGSAWTNSGNCENRMLRGGAFHEGGGFLRSAVRGQYSRAGRFNNSGFRVARDLE